jgi:conjugative relaxase-like TrwC/TraI family protein
MVSIGKLAAGQAEYYLEKTRGPVSAAAAVASGVEDYYLKGFEPAGVWLGNGTAALALLGKAEATELNHVLAGRRPADGSALRLRGSVPGFDVTFSAPKSVSVIFGVADPEVRRAVVGAHERAVREAFGFVESVAAVARRGAGGTESVAGNGLVAACFLHRTSRAGDPQLHTHVLVANMTCGPDGRWTALDARLLYAHGRTAGFLYQAALRAELSRELGVGWGPVRNGAAEIEGVPTRVLRAFSRRRAEIEQALAERGVSGPEAARVATLATRRAKDYRVTPADLMPEWRLRAAKLGLSRDRLRGLIGRAEPQRLTGGEWEQLFDELAGASGLTAQRSSFTRADVIRAICERLAAGAPTTMVERAADAFLASDRAVRLLISDPSLRPAAMISRRDGQRVTVRSEPVYSTPELLSLERWILDQAEQLRVAGSGLARAEDIAHALGDRPWLADEQRQMVERLARDGSGVAVVLGRAGTGKTSALAAAREAWQASGYRVVGCAVARRAAHELSTAAGIPATSVAALLRGEELPDRAIVVVDEAGMLGTRDLAALMRRVDSAEGKLVLVGDPAQLPSIEVGGALRALAARGDPIELRENRRQRAEWEREAVELLRDGLSDEALSLYARHRRLVVGEHGDEVTRRLVADWFKAGDADGSVMIAHRRRDVDELNGRARALLRAAGQLGEGELMLAGGSFAVGDQVVVKLNDRRAGVRNGERGVVMGLDQAACEMDVRLGDRVARLPRGFLEARTARGDPALRHGYAITAYVAQGLTCRRAFVLARDDAYREWAYTTMTRATDANRLYVIAERIDDRDEFAPAEPPRDQRAALIAALSRSQEQRLAIDLDRDAGIGLG